MPEAFRFLTAGESHGECLTAIIDGVPAALPLAEAAYRKLEGSENLARAVRDFKK